MKGVRVSAELHSKAVRIERRTHPTIDYYFDPAIHIVRRSKELAWESKELVVALLILILLIQHSFHVLMK
jgi:hypothetical protein